MFWGSTTIMASEENRVPACCQGALETRTRGHGHIPIEIPDMAIKVLKPVVVAKIVAKEAALKSRAPVTIVLAKIGVKEVGRP
jgi:hypothetical protein